MSKRVILYLLLSCISAIVHAQRAVPDSLSSLFYNQLDIFPQEKIYVHTDKPYYLSGEKIWFRAYLVNAITHNAVAGSRYVYVELINPLDSVVTRVKIREDEEVYHGYLPIPDNVPEGDYTLRAYTTFMRSQDVGFFFTKTLHIGDPQARTIDIKTDFFFESDRMVHATFKFTQVAASEPYVPPSAKVSVNSGRPMSLKVEGNGTATVNFNLPAASRQRTLLLEVTADRRPYRQFITVPIPDDDFDVSFYPEGGSLMMGTPSKVTFKAMKSNGQSTDISGVIYSPSGEEVRTLQTDHMGMGSFSVIIPQGETYYAVCENAEGASKRFDLPAALDYGYALAVKQIRDNIYVSVLKPAASMQNNELYLLAHTRGMIHLIDRWDDQKSSVAFPKELFPSGVLYFVLFDNNLTPVSERLVFVNNDDQAQVMYMSDAKDYVRRTLVKNSVTITGPDDQPLSGNFSVAVTSDREVQPDSTSNILTQLLLTSDLRGHIENPAYYFQHTPASAWALDLLMCTQGWRRYHMAELAQGHFFEPTTPIETASEVSGIVKSVLLGRPVEDVEVTVISLTSTGRYFNSTQTNKEGRFYLPLRELPDSTQFMVSVEPKRGSTRMDLMVDREAFPERTVPAPPPLHIDRNQFTRYANKAEEQYSYEGGVRVTQLSAAVVTAQRQPPRKSQYYTAPDNSLTQEEIERNPSTNVFDLLQRFPGVRVFRGDDNNFDIVIRGIATLLNPNPAPDPDFDPEGKSAAAAKTSSLSYPPPLLLVDEVPTDISFLNMVSVNEIAQIDILKGASAAIFGVRGSLGVIAIHLKDWNSTKRAASQTQSPNIKNVSPLGYQQPIAFYAPKYETDAQRYNGKPDLRTTIHWQPVVQTDSQGIASFEFYTADENTSYTVIIEGLADDGQIIRKEAKLWKKEDLTHTLTSII